MGLGRKTSGSWVRQQSGMAPRVSRRAEPRQQLPAVLVGDVADRAPAGYSRGRRVGVVLTLRVPCSRFLARLAPVCSVPLGIAPFVRRHWYSGAAPGCRKAPRPLKKRGMWASQGRARPGPVARAALPVLPARQGVTSVKHSPQDEAKVDG